MKSFLNGVLDLLFPPHCLSCGENLDHGEPPLFCAPCFQKIDFVREPLCSCCGRLFADAAGKNHFCSACLSEKRYYDEARAVVHYSEPVSGSIHSLKYGGNTAALASFAALKEISGQTFDGPAPDCIIPVPLHKKRLRQRGFNQAVLLARAFFPERRKLINPFLLQRRKSTLPQTGMDGRARRKNLRNAFLVPDPEAIRGRTILLVDDVFTTGTTVNECSRTLKKAGAGEVYVLTLARVKEE